MREQGQSRRQFFTTLGVAGFGSLFPHITNDSVARQQLLALINPIVERFDHYTAYEISEREFLGAVARPHDEIDLRPHGYHPHHLAAAKYHPRTGALDTSSWRRIDENNPRWQWHAHLWDDKKGRTELSSHYEYRPDARLLADESWTMMRERLENHYQPKWDSSHPPEEANYFLGATCGNLNGLIDQQV